MSKLKDLLYDYYEAIEEACLSECDAKHEGANSRADRIEEQILELINPKVKQLVWVTLDEVLKINRYAYWKEGVFSIISPVLYYEIKFFNKIGFTANLHSTKEGVIDEFCSHGKTLDEAKSACQKHYESLILSGIEVAND